MRTDALLWTPLLFLAAAAAYDDRGAFNPDVRQETIGQTICLPGYAKAVRPSTNFTRGAKQMLLKRAGRDRAQAFEYELGHVIPLGLGGHPRKLENLELQPRTGENGAKRKDRIEAKLQCLVCSGQVTLADAQREISTNWQTAYHKYARAKCRRR
jgi:cytochrome c-type biogenesis protein CcmH/NrfF